MEIILIIAFIGLLAATINDIRKREVADWINYSLLAVLFIITIAQGVIKWDFTQLLNAILFSAVLFVIGSALYYVKWIGGGDVKLIAALGPVFNFINILNFFALLLIVSGIYGIIYSITLGAVHRKKVLKEFKLKIVSSIALVFLLVGIIWGLNAITLISLITFIPCLLSFVRTVEQVALIKKLGAGKLTEGDWLLKDIKVRGKIIKAKAEGLTKKDIELIKRARINVTIKEGIPYVPVFIIAFILGNYFNLLEIITAFL